MSGNRVIYADQTGCAVFNEAFPGDQSPFTDPVNHAGDIFFHSENDYYALAQLPTTVTINHPLIPISNHANIWSDQFVIQVYLQQFSNIFPLVNHSLGVIPHVMVLDANGFALPNSFPIQVNAGGHRSVSIFATGTNIQMDEISESGTSTLTAFSADYTVYVFKTPASDPLKPMLEIDVPNGSIIFGQGKFDLTQSRLRRTVVPESPDLLIPAGRMTDIDSGCVRFVQANGTIIDLNGNGNIYGNAFIGSPHIEAKVI